jgi:hypothetical protein
MLGLLFATDRNLMRMYVILVLAALLVLGVSCVAAYLIAASRKARKRQAVAARLNAIVEQAERERADRAAAVEASAALTTVMPAIQPGERSPRRVA